MLYPVAALWRAAYIIEKLDQGYSKFIIKQ